MLLPGPPENPRFYAQGVRELAKLLKPEIKELPKERNRGPRKSNQGSFAYSTPKKLGVFKSNGKYETLVGAADTSPPAPALTSLGEKSNALVAHAFSVLCRHSCRHPTGQQKGPARQPDMSPRMATRHAGRCEPRRLSVPTFPDPW